MKGGIIAWRRVAGELEFLLGHPTRHGPQSWVFPKGNIKRREAVQAGAIREFCEETGLGLSAADIERMQRLDGGDDTHIAVFALPLDADPATLHSNLVKGESFPELDDYRWCSLDDALALAEPPLAHWFKLAAKAAGGRA